MDKIFGSQDLSAEEKLLLERAMGVRERAYCIYSKFAVGSALLDRRGEIFIGCNVENASYGAVICAERSAVAQMVSQGGKEISKLAVITVSREIYFPCGMCLQVIREFGAESEILAFESSGQRFKRARIGLLYPSAFSRESLIHE